MAANSSPDLTRLRQALQPLLAFYFGNAQKPFFAPEQAGALLTMPAPGYYGGGPCACGGYFQYIQERHFQAAAGSSAEVSKWTACSIDEIRAAVAPLIRYYQANHTPFLQPDPAAPAGTVITVPIPVERTVNHCAGGTPSQTRDPRHFPGDGAMPVDTAPLEVILAALQPLIRYYLGIGKAFLAPTKDSELLTWPGPQPVAVVYRCGASVQRCAPRHVSAPPSNDDIIPSPSPPPPIPPPPPLIPSPLLIKTMDELEVEEPHFAAGAFGNVHRGKYHGQKVAVKRLNGSSGSEPLMKELKMWSRLTHPNIVQLMGFTQPPLAPMIVMELMDCSLFNMLQNKDVSLSLLRRVVIAHDLAAGVSYLHAQQGVHRDIKSPNVLVRGNDIKLADFGGTRGLASLRTLSGVGTLRWNAPEMLTGEAASQASDVYAMGITFSEIFTREIPYAHLQADGAVVLAVVSGTRPQLWPLTKRMQELLGEGDLEQQTEGFRQLIQRCWEIAPERRPTAREVRLELADLLTQFQHLAGSSSSSSSGQLGSVPLPIYPSMSSFSIHQEISPSSPSPFK
ncbi:MAG: protein kinase [archaeon]|nr:protein kinase [archaeon]